MTCAASSDVLSPEDADTAFTGGVQVARMCVGLTPAKFITELGEAAAGMLESLRKARISPAIAQQTMEAFEIGATTSGGGSIDLRRRGPGAERDRCLIVPV